MIQENWFFREVAVSVQEGTDAGSEPVFDDNQLRIDFEYKQIGHYTRATVSVYNLAEKDREAISTVGSYISVSIKNKGDVVKLINRFEIRNAYTRLDLPDAITMVYCTVASAKSLVRLPKLTTTQTRTFELSLFERIEYLRSIYAAELPVDYRNFPDGYIFRKVLNIMQPPSGTFEDALTRVGVKFNVKWALTGGSLTTAPNLLVLVYDGGNTAPHRTALSTQARPSIPLGVIKKSPQIDTVKLTMNILLDDTIGYGEVIDTQNIISVDQSESEEVLQLATGFLSKHSFLRRYYRVLSFTHVGSNYTDKWDTTIVAYAPSTGRITKDDN